MYGAGPSAAGLIAFYDRTGTRPCDARPLQARRRCRRSTCAAPRLGFPGEVLQCSNFWWSPRGCGDWFRRVSLFGILFLATRPLGADDASHGQVAPSRSVLRPAGSGDRLGRGNCPVLRSALQRPRRLAFASGMNTAVPHDMGIACPIASPGSEEPR